MGKHFIPPKVLRNYVVGNVPTRGRQISNERQPKRPDKQGVVVTECQTLRKLTNSLSGNLVKKQFDGILKKRHNVSL